MKNFFNTFRNIYKVEELRTKIGNTLLFLLIYRLGSFVVLPGVDPNALGDLKQQSSDGILGLARHWQDRLGIPHHVQRWQWVHHELHIDSTVANG